MNLLNLIILGILQGIFEWLPISSEGVLTLISNQAFGETALSSLNAVIWLHMGTMFAALFYFREEFKKMLEELYTSITSTEKHQKKDLTLFIIMTTVISSVLGGIIYLFGIKELVKAPRIFIILMGFALLSTGILRMYKSEENESKEKMNLGDTIITGLLQGLSILPGISRSGSTVFGLFFRGFDSEEAFKISFLLSVPAVLIANIGIQLLSGFKLHPALLIPVLASFLTGLLSIDSILKLARKFEVSYVCFFLSAITFLTLLV